MTASYRAGVKIGRPENTTSADGQDFIDFWSNAIFSDLFTDVNGFQSGNGAHLARKAAHWFQEAWSSAGARERRFEVQWFVLQFFELPGTQGEMVAEINVLAGTYWEAA